jgi:hypothetical protein
MKNRVCGRLVIANQVLSRSKTSMAAVGTLLAALGIPFSAMADGGTFESLAAYSVDAATMQFGEAQVTSGRATGSMTITKSSGGPFEEGLVGMSQCFAIAERSGAGTAVEARCSATYKDGAFFFISRRKAGEAAAGSGEGISEIIGGTGRFAGITGTCRYRVDFLQNKAGVDRKICEWKK